MAGSRAATSFECSIILMSFGKYLASLDAKAWNTRLMFDAYLRTIGCEYQGKNTYTIVDEQKFAWVLLKYSDKKR